MFFYHWDHTDIYMYKIFNVKKYHKQGWVVPVLTFNTSSTVYTVIVFSMNGTLNTYSGSWLDAISVFIQFVPNKGEYAFI